MNQYKNNDGKIIHATKKAFELLYKDLGYQKVSDKKAEAKKKTVKEVK